MHCLVAVDRIISLSISYLVIFSERAIANSIVEFLRVEFCRAWQTWAWIRNSLSHDFRMASVSLQVHILITVAYILIPLLWALSILTL